MNFENYCDDKDKILGLSNRRKFLEAFVDLVRDLNGSDNFKAHQDMFPFSLECKNEFSVGRASGASQVNRLLVDVKADKNRVAIPVFLAWLWYRHEGEAKKLYDQFDMEHTPYLGEPDLHECPRYIEDAFSARSEDIVAKDGIITGHDEDQKGELPASTTGVVDQAKDMESKEERAIGTSEEEAADQIENSDTGISSGFFSFFVSTEFAISFVAGALAIWAVYEFGLASG